MSTTFFAKFGDQARSALAAILDQSDDCIKLIELDGGVSYMNRRGQTAMEIANFEAIAGERWDNLWPEKSRCEILHALEEGRSGRNHRFEGFCPTALGKPRWWDVMVTPMRNENGRVTRLLAVSRDITEQVGLRELASRRLEDAERDAEMQTLSASETRHRLKNLLAVIQSISTLVLRHSDDLSQYAEAFGGHLRRLATAQNLLAGGSGDLKLSAVIYTALEAAGATNRIELSAIPDVAITDQTVQISALVFGELHTNAMKHGALAHHEGRVRIDVAREESGLRVLWREDCGQVITAKPLAGGSGMKLINRMTNIAGRDASFHFEPRGLSASFWIPLGG